ncbi:MAG TPA: hypothetical protein VFI25_15005 [Planctomycetota bacterium]|jgi:hypothetical protein|nr:hypothetical protein [Planctomycetota bacterium]
MQRDWEKDTARILEILQKRESPLRPVLARAKDIRRLPHAVRLEIGDALSQEMLEEGFSPTDDFNEYGLELDGLIGACELTREDPPSR